MMRVQHLNLEVVLIAAPAPAHTTVPRAPLVFLHEGLGSVSQWSNRGNAWPWQLCQATGRSGVVYSRQGYGQSTPAPPGRYVRRADFLHDEAWSVLPDLLAQLGIAQPVLLGHSDGATIALLYASRWPVTACIAMAPHVFVEPIALESIAAAASAFESGGLRERLAKHHADVDGAFWQWHDVWLSDEFRAFDIRADCARIAAPLLLVQGLHDRYGTMRQLDAIAAAVPKARQCRLADCGHAPHQDQTEMTLNTIQEFLSDLS